MTLRVAAALVAGWLAAGLAAPPGAPDALASMADAERAFAKMAAGNGVRAAFLEYLDDDAIQLGPTIGRAKDTWQARPVPANPLATTLVWDPRVGDVSGDGRLGWLTGPYFIVPDGHVSKTAYGCYFSVWRRAAGGPWRVYIDLGISTPGPCEAPPAFEPLPPARSRAPLTLDALVSSDAAVAELGKSGLERSMVSVADPDLRVHLDGRQPLSGRDTVLKALEKDATAWTFTHVDAFVAASGDLGVSYGHAQRSGDAKAGSYVRVWRPDARGHWKLVFQTITR